MSRVHIVCPECTRESWAVFRRTGQKGQSIINYRSKKLPKATYDSNSPVIIRIIYFTFIFLDSSYNTSQPTFRNLASIKNNIKKFTIYWSQFRLSMLKVFITILSIPAALPFFKCFIASIISLYVIDPFKIISYTGFSHMSLKTISFLTHLFHAGKKYIENKNMLQTLKFIFYFIH